MNLSFIELLSILQLITIRNSSDGNNVKPQAIQFLYLTLESSARDFEFGPRVH